MSRKSARPILMTIIFLVALAIALAAAWMQQAHPIAFVLILSAAGAVLVIAAALIAGNWMFGLVWRGLLPIGLARRDDRECKVRIRTTQCFRALSSSQKQKLFARLKRRGLPRTAVLMTWLLAVLILGTLAAWGLGWRLNPFPAGWPRYIVEAITFAIVILVGVAVAGSFERLLADGFLAIGMCPSCSYDLTHLEVASNGCRVCPECGAAWRTIRARNPEDAAGSKFTPAQPRRAGRR